MKKKVLVKKSAAPFYLAAAAFVLCSFVLPFYRWSGLLISLLIAAAVFAFAEKRCPRETEVVEVPEEPKITGDARADEILLKGRAELQKIHAANAAVSDPVLSAKIDRMEELAEKIFAYLEENPGQSDKLRRFMSYYLPTTVKMLDNAVSLEKNKEIHGGYIEKSMESAHRAADLIVTAFEKQLDNLYEAKELDISTDVAVLEGMLKKEGLGEV